MAAVEIAEDAKSKASVQSRLSLAAISQRGKYTDSCDGAEQCDELDCTSTVVAKQGSDGGDNLSSRLSMKSYQRVPTASVAGGL